MFLTHARSQLRHWCNCHDCGAPNSAGFAFSDLRAADAEGAVRLICRNAEKQVEKALEIVDQIRGEPPFVQYAADLNELSRVYPNLFGSAIERGWLCGPQRCGS